MKNLKSYGLIGIGVLLGIFLMYIFSNYKIEKVEENNPEKTEFVANSTDEKDISERDFSSKSNDSFVENQSESESNIDELTEENRVIAFVKENKQLPDYYITKSDARRSGWVASEGNLCEVLPGRAIGGDKFSNREKQLPQGEQYYEADVNYNCGRRNADRIVFTKNGEVWLTKNHYKSFEKQ